MNENRCNHGPRPLHFNEGLVYVRYSERACVEPSDPECCMNFNTTEPRLVAEVAKDNNNCTLRKRNKRINR